MLSIYDDNESGTIYFNLKSYNNLSELDKVLNNLCSQSSSYEFHRILQKNENCYIKSLIFIFLTCHHILLFQNEPRFNPQWLSIFHFLQEIKLKLISPIIDIQIPLFNHYLKNNKDNNNHQKKEIMNFLLNNNLTPFIIPVLTFLYPAPNTSGYIILDDNYSEIFRNDIKNNNNDDDKHKMIEKIILKKFRHRLQHQIVVLLRRCHSIFPYFQTRQNNEKKDDKSDKDKDDKDRDKDKDKIKLKYSSLSHKELFECIEELKNLGFDTLSYLDSEIYSQHSRFIESDDMMHNNPLSLFSLLPNKFIQIYKNNDILNCIQFLFCYHESIQNDQLLLNQKEKQDSLNKITLNIKLINENIKSYLKTESKILPKRILFYVSSKTIYDSLFKNLNEIEQIEPLFIQKSFIKIYNLFNYDDTNRKNKKFYNISLIEKSYNKIHLNLNIDRLGRYSSLLCRRAYKSSRNMYLLDLPEMYPFSLHLQHIKIAMKIFRQQSIGPLQEYYCKQLYFEFNEIWKNGRQSCDQISLTGRPCCRPIHNGKNINLFATKKNQSAKFAEERHKKFGQDPQGHFSGFSSSHACNCGRTISKREDPFDLFDANIYYFQKSCCKRVQWNYKLTTTDNNNTDNNNDNKDDDDDHNKKKKQTHHYKSGFNLCNHGGAELYHKQTGITQPGFDRYNCFLLRWDIPIPTNVYIFHQHYKQKSARFRDNYYHNNRRQHNQHYNNYHHHHGGHHYNNYHHIHHHQIHEQNDENLGLWIHKIRKTVSIAQNKPNCNAYFPCFVGLEFECYRGHRAILDYSEIIQLDKIETINDNNDNLENNVRFIGTQFPTQNIPLRVPCKQCQNFRGHHGENKSKNKNKLINGNIINGQLQRAFIVTPPPPISIEAKPVIISNLSDAIFEFDTPVILPPSSFLVLRFPYIYFHDGRGLPPDKLSLCKAMLTVQNFDNNNNNNNNQQQNISTKQQQQQSNNNNHNEQETQTPKIVIKQR